MKVIVIGGGPAGMLAAISAKDKGNEVILLEKMDRLGKKLAITGKGRCNITSSLPSMNQFIENIPGNGRFLYSAFQNFSNKDIRFGHNLRRLLLGGFFDTMLDLDRNKFWYDTSMSTTDLCQQEENFQKSLFNFTLNTALKTMGVDIKGVKAMSDEESYEWHKKHSKIDPKTGNLIISDDEIGDGTFEKQYPKL